MTSQAVNEGHQAVFPADFVWGAATAAYQIEGAAEEDGRGRSIWDTFSHTPGRVLGGDTGDVAADHYHRMPEDVAIMKRLGLRAYRFSVSWPAIQSNGAGPANQVRLDWYSRLVDELLGAGIDPLLTLYHWDLPQALQDVGGWASRETSYRFAEYAHLVATRLGDRVPTWTTLNEPWCSAFLGYAAGVHAPGLTEPATALCAAHHLLLGHGLAVEVLRDTLPQSALLSITLNLAVPRPFTDTPADIDATRHVDGLANRLFLDAVLRGRYPADIIEDTAPFCDWSFVRDGDLTTIAAPLDVLGVNYYTSTRVAAPTPELFADSQRRWSNDPHGKPGVALYPASTLACTVAVDGPRTAMGWLIDPTAFTDLLLRLHRDYQGVPLMITENGAAFSDQVEADGRIRDDDRIEYLRAHLLALHDARRQGVDVRGYFAWSLMDNFEWAYGYSRRFGLVHVDYETQQRRLKDSAHWYREVIATNTVPPPH